MLSEPFPSLFSPHWSLHFDLWSFPFTLQQWEVVSEGDGRSTLRELAWNRLVYFLINHDCQDPSLHSSRSKGREITEYVETHSSSCQILSQSSPITSSMKRIGRPNIAAQQMYVMRKAPVENYQAKHSSQSVWSFLMKKAPLHRSLKNVHPDKGSHSGQFKRAFDQWRTDFFNPLQSCPSFPHLLHFHTRVRGISRCCPVPRRIRRTLECTVRKIWHQDYGRSNLYRGLKLAAIFAFRIPGIDYFITKVRYDAEVFLSKCELCFSFHMNSLTSLVVLREWRPWTLDRHERRRNEPFSQ